MTPRKLRRTPPGARPRLRRGATLVIVAMLIVLIGGMAAFAIDLARIYSGVNEMQTGADAAALAGALRMQRIAGASPVGGVQAFAASNAAFGSALALDANDIRGGFWNPVTEVFTPTGNWTASNAIHVTARSTPTLAFGRLLNRGSLTATRSAIAWIGNQSARDCIKPWGFDRAYVYGLLGQPLSGQAGVNALRSLLSTTAGQYQLTIVASPDISNPVGTPTAAPTTFMALTSPTLLRKEYPNAIVGQNCELQPDYVVGGTESIVPQVPGRNIGDVPFLTMENVELNALPGIQTCSFRSADEATCYDPNSLATAGVVVGVTVATQVAPDAATIDVLLEFRLMCVFRGNTAVAGSSRATENCPWLTAAGQPADNYLQGTLVGYPVSSVALTGPGNGLGNNISSAQKLILVK